MTPTLWQPPEAASSPGHPSRTPVADLIEETFRIYRRAFVTMVVISALVQVPLVLANAPLWAIQGEWSQLMGEDPNVVAAQMMESFWTFFGLTLLLVLAAGILGTFGWAAMIVVAVGARAGDPPSLGQTFRRLGQLTPRLLGYWVLWLMAPLVVFIGLALVLLGVFAIASFLAPGSGLAFWWVLIAVVVAVVFLGFVAVRVTLSLPALVLEGVGPVRAAVRSWELVRGSVWRTLGIFLVAWVAIALIASVASPLYLPGMFEGMMSGSMTTYVVLAVVSAVVNTLVGPVLPILLTLLYFDYAAGLTSAEPDPIAGEPAGEAG